MKHRGFVSVLSVLLSVLMLIGSLPLGIFAAGTPSGNATPNYTDFRGKFGMSADANGVMIYDGLENYCKISQKDVKLSTNYSKAEESEGSVIWANTTYPECPYLYADYAIYFDESIEGTTAKVRYGLSMMDSVYYVDSATGEIVKGDKSPIELSASYRNDANPDYNAGFGLIYDEEGALEYTTRYYAEKGIIFYILNHRASERIGQEDDVSILTDYIEQGYLVVTVDFKSHEKAVTPYIETSLVSLRAMFDNCTTDTALKSLGVTTGANWLYFLPEGCRLERDVWYWDSSIYGVNGSMERYREMWNTNISCEAEENLALEDPKTYDTLGIGSVESVEEMISRITKKDGTPIEYKHSMDIIYPSQPKEDYEVPVYLQESTASIRENNILSGYTRCSYTAFALNGYACLQYDTPTWPFIYRDEYLFGNYGASYGLVASSVNNSRAAVRCAKYLAKALGYSDTLVGAGGISKATVGLAALSVKNNKLVPQSAVAVDGVTYDNSIYEGDILVDGVVTKAIVQPFTYYDEACEAEVNSDCVVTYNATGDGVKSLFMGGYLTNCEKVPMVLSSGAYDYAHSLDYWEAEVNWFEENATEPFLPIVQLDQGHAYIVGYDDAYGYYRFDGMLKFFDVYLKPDAARAPEVLWVTPLDGACEVPIDGEWALDPITPTGWETESYSHEQSIQIRFVSSVDPTSVNAGVTIADESGKKLNGTWEPSQHNALYTFVCDEIEPGTNYTLHITNKVKGENGVALEESRTVTFRTEGSYHVRSAAEALVSSTEPDKAFGEIEALTVSLTDTALISFETENVIDALEISLRAEAMLDSTPTVNVYVLADTLVDGTSLTYNTLIADEAWSNKVLLDEYAITDGKIKLDLTALAELQGLGEYVTLALVSADEIAHTPYVYENDFETPVIGETVMNGDIIVIREDGKVTDPRVQYTLSDGSKITPWTSNIPVSPYLWCRTGNISDGWLINDSKLADGQIFRVWTKAGENARQKFFNTLTDDATNGLVAEDVGKTFRATFDIYPIRDLMITVGMNSPTSSTYVGATYTHNISANTWTTVTCDFTVTAEMVSAQAGMLAVTLNYPVEETTYKPYTYFDNMRVEEITPAFTVEKGGFSLITTKRGLALNAPIEVTLDETIELSAFAENATVCNERTGRSVKGEWIAIGEDGKSFAFVTKGLEPDTSYAVKMSGEVLRTVRTEGSYALRPIATSYVSVSEPEKHFGLDVEPILDGDKLGVLAFSAKTLKNATASTLYLSVDTEKNTAVSVYALTDVALDSTFCYNAIVDRLTSATLLDTQKAMDGSKLAIDLSALADKELGENVVLVIKAGHTFYNDFESPKVTAPTAVTAGNSAQMPDLTEFYSDTYFWGSLGAMANGFFKQAAGDKTQTFYAKTNKEQRIKFYNTLKDEAFDENDIGRSYKVSFKIYSVEQNANNEGAVDAITLTMGYTTRQNTTYNGTKYTNVDFIDVQSKRPEVTLTLDDTAWTDVSFDVTVNETMVGLQAGCLTLQVPAVWNKSDSTKSVILAHYFDEMKVEEVVNYNVSLPTDGMMLMTENSASVAVTDSDNPVKDEGFDLPNVDASLISYQVTKGEDGVFSMRLVAGLDSLGYKCFGYEITLTTAEGTETVSGETTKVYTAIYGGDTLYSIKDNFGYEYAGLATVAGLALDSASTELAVSAYVLTEDGEKLYGRSATLLYTGETDGEGYPVLTVE